MHTHDLNERAGTHQEEVATQKKENRKQHLSSFDSSGQLEVLLDKLYYIYLSIYL